VSDDYGDEAELDIIIEQGQLEAEQFGGWMNVWPATGWKPAKWLNPPHPVEAPIERSPLLVEQDVRNAERWHDRGQ
jgi:hypothetical protein